MASDGDTQPTDCTDNDDTDEEMIEEVKSLQGVKKPNDLAQSPADGYYQQQKTTKVKPDQIQIQIKPDRNIMKNRNKMEEKFQEIQTSSYNYQNNLETKTMNFHDYEKHYYPNDTLPHYCRPNIEPPIDKCHQCPNGALPHYCHQLMSFHTTAVKPEGKQNNYCTESSRHPVTITEIQVRTCADPGVRTPIGMSRISYKFNFSNKKRDGE